MVDFKASQGPNIGPNCCSPENLGSLRVNVDGIIALAKIRRALLTDDLTEVAPLIIPDSD